MSRSNRPANKLIRGVKEGALQVDTVMREAANVLTMDGADQLEAVLHAATHSSGLPTLGLQYRQARQNQRARAAYDREHRKAATIAGQGLGYGLSFGAAGLAAVKGMGRLSNKAKGNVGERLSDLKTIAKGDIPYGHQQPIKLSNGMTTKVDQKTLFQKGIVESKYRAGRPEKLRGAQLQAQKEFGPLHRYDQWGNKDIRRMGGAGGVGAAAGNQAAGDYRNRR